MLLLINNIHDKLCRNEAYACVTWTTIYSLLVVNIFTTKKTFVRTTEVKQCVLIKHYIFLFDTAFPYNCTALSQSDLRNVYYYRSQNTTQRVKNNSHATRLRLVSYTFRSLYAVASSVIYYSKHTRENVIYLLNK